MWSEKYEQDMEDIFLVQDKISKKVLTALQVKLVESEQARVWARGTDNIDAYIKYLQAYEHFRSFSKDNMILTRKGMQEAIELDPNYDAPYVVLGSAHMIDFWYNWGESRETSIKKAQSAIQKAIKLAPESDLPNAVLGHLYLLQRQFDKAVESGEKAVLLNPNGDLNLVLLGITYSYVGRSEESLSLFDKAQRLNPNGPAWYIHNAASAYIQLERWDEAIAVCKQALKGNPDHYPALILLASAYGLSGRIEEGRAVVSNILKINPNATLTRRASRFKDKAHDEMVLDGLRKVGFPEQSVIKKPDNPSIAVLPFENMSGDPEQEYFSDGMTDELIGDLAKIKDIFVISRNSAFTYKGKSVKIQQIAEELNVRYILEGSVQKSGDKVRIRAQLIDGKTDHHLWSESYDALMDDIFELQDNITGKIVSALAIKLTSSEKERISDKGTDNILAYNAFLKGQEHLARLTGANIMKAIDYYKEAVQIDPNFSRAYAQLASCYNLIISNTFLRQLKISSLIEIVTLKYKARHYLELAMKNPTYDAYRTAAYFSLFRRNYDEAVSFAETVLSIAPNESVNNLAMGSILSWMGRADEALLYIDKAIQLDPLLLDIKLGEMGLAYFVMGNYEKAVEFTQRCLTLNPGLNVYASYAAASYAFLNQQKEAEQAWNIFKDGFPEGIIPSTKFLYWGFPFKNHKVFDRYIEGLIKAGFKGEPSDYFMVIEKNKLNGQEIRKLLFGKKQTGIIFGFPWSNFRSKDGKLESPDIFGGIDKGKSWIEGDEICNQFENLYEGVKYCNDIYYNPKGNAIDKSQYLSFSDALLLPFSIED